MSVVLFGIWPFVALVIFIVGHVWRWKTDQFGWTTRSSQILERRWLAWGSPLFHLGCLLVILGHIAGLIVPESWTRRMGISESAYHLVAVIGGVVGGILLTAGLVILILRRLVTGQRLRIVTRPMDWVLYALLVVIIGLGLTATFTQNVAGDYDYRGTISLWFRSLFVLHPAVGDMAGVPVIYQLHIAVACLLVAIWPFTRLVHVWSVPVGYLVRPSIIYRRAAGKAL